MSRFATRRAQLMALVGGTVVACAAASWLYAHAGVPPLLHTGDAKEYAVMARRLVGGEGFTTGVIYPAELEFGAGEGHPAVMRPPLWPMLLAGAFVLGGDNAWTVHVVLFLCHLAAAAGAAALGWRLAGPAVAVLAGVTTALTPQFLAFSADGLSEPLFAACVTLAFVLAAWRASPLAIGVACGLAYLARYNGAVLVVALALPILVDRRPAVGALGALGLGFLVCVLPWWVRNWMVTGDPFYTLLSLNLYFPTEQIAPRSSLYYVLQPDLGQPPAMAPLAKAPGNLAKLIRQWPLLAVNFAAVLGVVLAAVRRDPLSIAFILATGATTLAISLALPNGRYFVPFIPVLIALGAAGWARYGGRVSVPLLALVLVSPVLPSVPADLPDVQLMRNAPAIIRATRSEQLDQTTPSLRRCLEGAPLVIAQDAPTLAWEADVVAIYQPAGAADFWRIVDEYPVRFVHTADHRSVSRKQLLERFVHRPDCDERLYARRTDPL